MAGDDSDVNLGSEDWTNTLDRGGLWLVNDQTFTFFAIMEELIQSKWTKANVEEQGEGAKQSLSIPSCRMKTSYFNGVLQ